MKYSVLIPVFNRPDECSELLDSLEQQTMHNFEVLVVDDGSTITCKDVCNARTFPLHYYFKSNSGPGSTRNYAAERASGEWLIILDSDCMLPPDYMAAVEAELKASPCDAWGGPDAAHQSFTPLQKAINYAMTSPLTTGGIRGGRKRMDRFYPRSFNMGIKRDCYLQLGGFSDMRFGEDVDFSMRIVEAGYRTRLMPTAWVWHKRRTDLVKFFRQVHNSGIARINLEQRHPGSMKLVHTLPAVAVLVAAMLLALTIMLATTDHATAATAALIPLLLYAATIAIHATHSTGTLSIGLLSVVASAVQITGYGTGFISAAWQRYIMGREGDLQAFRKTFYK